MKVGIIGLGWVGGTVRQWFERDGCYGITELCLYDKFKHIGSVDEVNRADVIFVAVPTPYIVGKGYDDSAVCDAISNIQDGKVVVIKSTVMPGSTARFQFKNPRKTILFNPEFLREKTAVQDFNKPDRQIIGYDSASGKSWAQEVLDILPAAPYRRIIKSEEAELVKYFGNVFLASKVIFANQLFDICVATDVDYNVVREAAAQDVRIGSSHLDVWDNGFRGYGGHCFPKDTRALLQYAQSLGVNTDFLETMERINKELTGGVDRTGSALVIKSRSTM
jgi:UDPglucose 6-dehydrogenase